MSDFNIYEECACERAISFITMVVYALESAPIAGTWVVASSPNAEVQVTTAVVERWLISQVYLDGNWDPDLKLAGGVPVAVSAPGLLGGLKSWVEYCLYSGNNPHRI